MCKPALCAFVVVTLEGGVVVVVIVLAIDVVVVVVVAVFAVAVGDPCSGDFSFLSIDDFPVLPAVFPVATNPVISVSGSSFF